MKESVHLRKKHLKNSESLYLDIYYKGKRTYEYLNLYLTGEKSKDKETLRLAEAIKAKRIVDLQNKAYGFARTTESVYVKDYTLSKIVEFKADGSRRGYLSLLIHLANFIGEHNFERLTFQDITADFAFKFKTYMEKLPTIKQNTKCLYWSKFKAIIHRALKDEVLRDDITKSLTNIKGEETKREFLTMDELQVLADTPIRDIHETIKRAFLFSCLTGLRCSDVRNLTWNNIEDDLNNKQSRIVFRQQKTGNQEYLVINTQARALMGIRNLDGRTKVFTLPQRDAICKALSAWVKTTSINKHITFHSARHTFAIILLELDTDIYTVSKLLGHRELKTTQIYAKILDKKKIEAVEKIPNIFKSNAI